MDSDLRTSLWNNFHQGLKQMLRGDGYGRWQRTAALIWHNLLVRPIDEIPEPPARAIEKIKEWFYDAHWYEVYDAMEAFAGILSDLLNAREGNAFKQACNQVLERESSGYRFVGDVIAPITNDIEIEATEAATRMATEHNLHGVNEHLRSALEKLSDKKNPDYRNSIKESISAVESACKVIARDSGATLPKALSELEKKIDLHTCQKKGFAALYNYTSDADGIRHAILEKNNSDFADASYMLVSCSAFVNYLVARATEAGLLE